MAYRTEHPNPQFQRGNYECLNGTWGFAVGKADGRTNTDLDGKIEVPFCPESVLSGIGDTRLITDCVYTREIDVISADLSGRLFLHFGAVDYYAEIYVNGVKAASHEGGYTSFEAEITPFVYEGKNRISVVVHDDVRENVPSGKQTYKEKPFGCFYTRVTGIWQSVWLERTPKEYIRQIKYYPDVKNGRVGVDLITEGQGHTEITVYYDGKEVGYASGDGYFRQTYEIALSEKHIWEIGKGELYDVTVRFGNDEVKSYFGLRTTEYRDEKFLLNDKSVFQRLVLDQGYYPDGLYTAADADMFASDIELTQKLGFNGARLHQRVFDQRYLYECDKRGFIVWGEYASWGVRYEDCEALGTFVKEWTECVEQYFNHPSIITWCPLNETWNNFDDIGKERDIRFIESVYHVTKSLDSTRPCVDVSGGFHGRYTDLFDFHCYHNADEISTYIKAIERDGELVMNTLYGKNPEKECALWDGKTATHASEYGGVALAESEQRDDKNSWGYDTCKSEKSFVEHYISTTQRFMDCAKICGCCYTQLYDVEQEKNGFFTFDRKPKLSQTAIEQIVACNNKKASIERS